MCLKIGYFADGLWAHQAFKKLINDESIKIVFLCVRYDKRDFVLLDYAETFKIPVVIHCNINSDEFLNSIKNFQADLFVSMSFNQIFKNDILNISKLGIINCHAGKLPFYRGRNILNWALINDEKEFGITVHYVDQGIDTGDIILQKTYPITDEDNYETLLNLAYKGCAEVLYEAIKLIQNGKVIRIPQISIDQIGTYCGMRQPGDEIIEWKQTSREIFNFVRALCKPGPQAISFINNKIIYINKIQMIHGAHKYKNIIGQVLGKSDNGFYVKTGDTMVEVMEYTYDGNIRIGDRLRRDKSICETL